MKNKKSKTSKEDLTGGEKLGIKGLSKGKRRKLEAYQHLFYLLQVINLIFSGLYASLNYVYSKLFSFCSVLFSL